MVIGTSVVGSGTFSPWARVHVTRPSKPSAVRVHGNRADTGVAAARALHIGVGPVRSRSVGFGLGSPMLLRAHGREWR